MGRGWGLGQGYVKQKQGRCGTCRGFALGLHLGHLGREGLLQAQHPLRGSSVWVPCSTQPMASFLFVFDMLCSFHQSWPYGRVMWELPRARWSGILRSRSRAGQGHEAMEGFEPMGAMWVCILQLGMCRRERGATH